MKLFEPNEPLSRAAPPLRVALAALRAETHGASPQASATLERVLASSRSAARRRGRLAKLWLPLAAVLVASSAWAAAEGGFSAMFAGAPAPEQVDAKTPFQAPSPVSLNPLATALRAQVSAAPSVAASAMSDASLESKRGHVGFAKTSGGLAEDKAAFESATRVHASMSQGSLASAEASVRAWSHYLAQHPNGRFLPEARYARAVALVRAGQHDEAKRALQPFAKGAPGGYRQGDAQAMLRAIEPPAHVAGE